jgi:deoxyribonuclease-4
MVSTSFQFGTVGSPISRPKYPGGSIGAIKQTAVLGLSALELAWVRSVRISEKKCAEIKETSEEENVSISVHAPYYINLNANNEEWPKSRKRLMDAAHFGHLAGATDVVIHPGSYFKQPPEVVLPAVIDRLRGCVDELREVDNPITLRPEMMGKSAMIGSLEDTLLMSRSIEGVEPCMDFAHLHARTGDGTMNTYDEWVRIIETYKEALGSDALKRLHTHLSGIEYGPKGERNHLPIQDSDFNLVALLRALNDYDCGGRILCESPVMEEDALFFKKLWKEMTELEI